MARRSAAAAALVLTLAWVGWARAQEAAMTTLRTDDLTLDLDATGQVVALRAASGVDVLDRTEPSPLAAVQVGGRRFAVTAADGDAGAGRLTLRFGGSGCTATVAVLQRPTHLRLELVAVEGAVPEIWEWGPFRTTVGATIGETVGVVRDDRLAFGIQALTPSTIGGLAPERLGAAGRRQAATATVGGSSLQAYTVEREGGVLGSAIALFGCPAAAALERIGEIEIAEGLPHPTWQGEWLKTSRAATQSYLICPFGEATIEQAVDRAREAGVGVLYHPGPFRTWGHFDLNPQEFPRGDAGLAECSRRARVRGVGLGVHTLTAFITTNDPYVTPVPDPRLARWGSSVLTAAVAAETTEIAIADPAAFRERGTLGAAILGAEIVQYGSVSETEPWTLRECKRGAFGTTASAHAAGADIGHLADHAYRTLFPGIEDGMAEEMAARLVELFNRADLEQISFDGLEGLSQYGYGEWPRNTFVSECYRGWKRETISDASNLLHYLWHIHTRMNWGEPWGYAMREGMTEYRFANQDYFERNLFPKMLGWFQLRLAGGDLPATSLADIEWVLSKAAGFDAGFALSTSLDEMAANGQTARMLEAMRQWEAARHAGAFSPEQRERLRGVDSEWRLEGAAGGGWTLYPARLATFRYPDGAIQPGQPPTAQWTLDNPYGEQAPTVTVRVLPGAGAPLSDPTLSVGGREVSFRGEVAAGQYLVFAGGREATVCDANWRPVGALPADAEMPAVGAGETALSFTSVVTGAGAPRCEVTFRLQGPGEAVPGGRG